MSRLDALLKTLSEAPETQIKSEMTKQIKMLIGCSNEIVATELAEIRDACVAKALASGFAIKILSEAVRVAEMK